MPLPATLPAAIFETVLTSLAALFLAGAGGDSYAARQAATHMLAAYHPETADELCLAASIIGFSLHALEALGQAAAPDIPLARILRLRGSAVSLSRESTKAARRLAELRKSSQQAVPAERQPEPEPKTPQVRPTANIALTPAAPTPAAPTPQALVRAQEQHQTDLRIAASIKRAEAKFGSQSNPAIPLMAQPTSAPPPRPMAQSG